MSSDGSGSDDAASVASRAAAPCETPGIRRSRPPGGFTARSHPSERGFAGRPAPRSADSADRSSGRRPRPRECLQHGGRAHGERHGAQRGRRGELQSGFPLRRGRRRSASTRRFRPSSASESRESSATSSARAKYRGSRRNNRVRPADRAAINPSDSRLRKARWTPDSGSSRSRASSRG